MKTILLTTTFLFAVAGSALAADVVVQEAEPIYNWSGVYVGAQAGYAWGDSTYNVDTNSAFVPYDPNGWFGGIFSGYNYQFNNDVVVGVEGDFSFSDVKAGRTIIYIPDPFPGEYGDSQVKWQGTVRGRLGYAVDRFLPYVTGGVAFAKYDYSIGGSWGTKQFSDNYAGWTAGAGLEYAFANNFTARVEYRYSDYGDKKYPFSGGALPHTTDLTTHDLRLGVAYKF